MIGGRSQSVATSDAETFLLRFHARAPGGTVRAFAGGKDSLGRSSYQRLIQSVPELGRECTLLDLGCGDGYLLEQLRGRWPQARLIGIDMSPEELHAARMRLGDRADLRCERAQTMSLGEGSVDCVVSHMALMLMAPIDEVMSEVHRVLRPGGVFAVVVGGDSRPPGAWAEFVAIARELCGAPTLALGDGRMRTPGGTRQLFAAPGAWSEIGIEDFELSVDGVWPEVESLLFGTYIPELLDASLREPLRREAAARIPALADADGVIPCRVGMRLLRFRRLPDAIYSR
jgi:SAM-dependent methyltransferase